MTWQQWFSIIKDALGVVIAGGGVVIASMGLKTWRRQLKGTYEYELARRLSLASLKVKDAIRGVRNPMVWGGKTREVYQGRWNNLLKEAREMNVALMEAHVVWDKKKATELRTETERLLGSLSAAIDLMLMDKDNPPSAGNELFDKEQRNILYAGSDGQGDLYAGKIDDLVSEVEKLAKPHLKK